MLESQPIERAPAVVVSASLAYDHIMTFPGSFKEHILPDKAHVLSVSFLVDSFRRQRGGIAGNIAYNLALLGEPSAVVGTVGTDFAEYRSLLESLGVDTRGVVTIPDEVTASCFITTDFDDNQITGFYPGAMARAAEVSVTPAARPARIGVVGADAPAAMRLHAREFSEAGCPLFYDPSQQVISLPAEDLIAGIDVAKLVIGNDYELAMMERKTGLDVRALAGRVEYVVVTLGERGSELWHQGAPLSIPAAPAEPLTDPTGGGDAYRAGLIKGLLLELEPPLIGRLASLAATYAIERHGTQEHSYTPLEFVGRFDRAFPDFAGAVSTTMLSTRSAAPAVR
jgi:adenosine kinase